MDGLSSVGTLAWHAIAAEQALTALGGDIGGLASSEAERRLARFGPNRIPEGRAKSPLRILIRQFASPLIYLLLFAAVLSLLIGDLRDALFILGVLLLNALIGGFQEWQADTSARALRSLVPQIARVRRDGHWGELPSDAVVPGDIVELESGMRVPADLRLIEAYGLLADEALLTGESLPVAKDAAAPVAADAILADRVTLAHAGTTVVEGRAIGLAVATGQDTAIGGIARSLRQAGRAAHASPLLRRMDRLARQIAVATVALILALAGLLALEGESWRQIALLGIALAVSAIPEGLPIAVTVALSAAANRMAHRNVIVRRLPAVEGLGSVTLIASDKTGTLTMNSLTVECAVLPGGARMAREEWQGDGLGQLHALGQAAALCNEARLNAYGTAVGDSVDLALLDFAEQTGNDPAALLAERRLAIIPYEPVQRFAAAEVDIGGSPLLVVKGAPETVLPMCPGSDSRAADLAEQLAADGYRVLVLAQSARPGPAGAIADRLHGLEVVGLVGLGDPVRPGVVQAVRQCISAGISVRMITGDHPRTALAIARQIGIAEHLSEVVSGAELKALQKDPLALRRKIATAKVFARTEPSQKLEIVRVYQDRNEIVAVTGDGVNDGPALQAADIGIAMGRGGTDVARGAADLVLADDNFVSIVAGIEEGRATLLNVRKIVLFLLATGAAEIGMFLAALACDLPMPLTPIQLLWLNLVTNGVQDVTLGFGRGEGHEMEQSPSRKLGSLLDRGSFVLMSAAAAAMTVMAVWLLAAELGSGATVDQARNSVLLLVVLFQNALLLSIRNLHHPVWRHPVRENRWLFLGIGTALALHLGSMHLAPMQQMLGIAPVSLALFGTCLAGSALVLAIAEAAKWFLFRPRPHAVRSSPANS